MPMTQSTIIFKKHIWAVYIITKMGKFAPHLHFWKTKMLSLSVGAPDQGLCHWTALGAPPPDPHYKLMLRAQHMFPTFMTKFTLIHCVSKNDTDVAHYNFNAHQPILVIFWRDIAEWACCCRMVICCPTSPCLCLCTTWGNMHPRYWVFSVMLYTVSKTTLLWLAISSTFINQFW